MAAKSRRRRRRRARRRVPVLVTAPLVTAMLVAASVALVRIAKPPAPSACAVTSASGVTYSLGPVQTQNASIIAAVAYRKQLPDLAVWRRGAERPVAIVGDEGHRREDRQRMILEGWRDASWADQYAAVR